MTNKISRPPLPRCQGSQAGANNKHKLFYRPPRCVPWNYRKSVGTQLKQALTVEYRESPPPDFARKPLWSGVGPKVDNDSTKRGKLRLQEALSCTVPIKRLRIGFATGRVDFERKRHFFYTCRSDLGQDACRQRRASDFGGMVQEDVAQSNGVQVGATANVNALAN
jgi:hypothetical protein